MTPAAAPTTAWPSIATTRLRPGAPGLRRAGSLGRRIRKDDQSGTQVIYDYYYNVAWQLLEVRKDCSPNAHKQYVWSARYIDAPVLRDRDADDDSETGHLGKTDSGLDQRLYYLTDANMNVTCLTDENGDAVERYHYSPYGEVTFMDGSWGSRSSSSYDNNVLYCGYYRDAETGLYSVRNRFYHAPLGRWLQRDPLAYVDGMSLYEYCAGMSVSVVDPSGLGALGKFLDQLFGRTARPGDTQILNQLEVEGTPGEQMEQERRFVERSRVKQRREIRENAGAYGGVVLGGIFTGIMEAQDIADAGCMPVDIAVAIALAAGNVIGARNIQNAITGERWRFDQDGYHGFRGHHT